MADRLRVEGIDRRRRGQDQRPGEEGGELRLSPTRSLNVGRVLKGRCACHSVEYEVSDEFVVAFICHCSNCRATTGSAFLPWGEIEREKFRVTKGAGSLTRLGEEGADHEMRCGVCWSLVYWTRTAGEGAYVRVPYGTLIDEPELKPMAHMFVGSKAPWYEISDDLPWHHEYPWSS